MKWTRTAPTAIGWYWFRTKPYGEPERLAVVEVVGIKKGGPPDVIGVASYEIERDSTAWSSEPVPMPEEESS